MISRETVRKDLYGLLEAGVPAAELVIAYQSSDFGGKSPVVMITSAGTTRQQFTAIGLKGRFYFGIHVFVLHADPDSVPPWTEEDAEDMIDQVEYEIAQVFGANQTSEYWQGITWEDTSIIDKITVSGDPFLYEVIPVAVEVFK